MLSQQTVDQVKAFPDIVGLISQYVTLKRRGRNYTGLCPFHNEKTPSFTVSPDKHIFHCFGCHESGDHISFIRKIDNLSFVDSVKVIAGFAGIEVVEDERGQSAEYKQNQELKDRLKDLLVEVRLQFESDLKPNTLAYRYLEGRGVTKDTIREFHLGYAPSDFNIISFTKSKGMSPDLLPKSGVVYESSDGIWRSRFKNRVMFPLIDHHGRTVGFGGRVLDAQTNAAKYVNSEDSILFNKRKVLYGLNQAKNGLKRVGYAILMEGYMDVIMAHQFGVDMAVACMGTAITTDQVQLLKRYVDKVYLAMDADDAGQRAIEKSFETLRDAGMIVYVVNLTDKDPADVILKNGVDHFYELIESAQPMIAFKFKRLLQEYPEKNIEDIPKIIEELVPLLQAEKEAVVVQHYIKKIAAVLEIDSENIMAKMQKARYTVGHRLVFASQKSKSKFKRAEEGIVYLIFSDFDLRKKIFDEVGLEVFAEHKALVQLIAKSQLVDKALLESIEDEKVKGKLANIVLNGGNEGINVEEHLPDLIYTLQSYSVKQRILELKREIKELDSNGEEEQVNTLLHELQALKNI